MNLNFFVLNDNRKRAIGKWFCVLTCCSYIATLESASHIIQNGRLVGTVAHVLVDDSTRGYAIFAENMLATAQGTAVSKKLKDAS